MIYDSLELYQYMNILMLLKLQEQILYQIISTYLFPKK